MDQVDFKIGDKVIFKSGHHGGFESLKGVVLTIETFPKSLGCPPNEYVTLKEISDQVIFHKIHISRLMKFRGRGL